jgi:hypothetical protein
MQRLSSCSRRPSENRHVHPKVATAALRMPNLPLASAPTSEDMAAGYELPARHGLPEAICVVEPVTRFAAPNDPAQTVLPRQGAPKSQNRLPA